MIKVADASVISSYPVSSGQLNIENLVHIVVNRDIGVEEDACFVGREFESSELGPCVFEAGSNKGCLLVGWGKEWVNALDN